MRFYLDQDQFNQFKRALLIRTIPLLLLPLTVVLIFNRPEKTTAILLILMFLAIIFFVMRNSIKKQKKAWETFELIIGEFNIERKQEGFPDILISKNEVTEAVEAKNGSVSLISKSNSNMIIIPFSVENKAALLETLSEFTTIRKVKNNNGLLLTYGAGIMGIVLLFSFMLSTNFYFTIVTGFILVAFNIWSFIEIQRNKNIDSKVKRSGYFTFILLIVVAAKLVVAFNEFFS